MFNTSKRHSILKKPWLRKPAQRVESLDRPQSHLSPSPPLGERAGERWHFFGYRCRFMESVGLANCLFTLVAHFTFFGTPARCPSRLIPDTPSNPISHPSRSCSSTLPASAKSSKPPASIHSSSRFVPLPPSTRPSPPPPFYHPHARSVP